MPQAARLSLAGCCCCQLEFQGALLKLALSPGRMMADLSDLVAGRPPLRASLWHIEILAGVDSCKQLRLLR